ncbi:54S ribosomal protein L19, mitochondrial [Tanacetum coccineum]
MSNKVADNMSSGVEQPTTNLSPDMPNDPVVQSNKDLALNEQPDGAAVESKSNDVEQANTDLDVHAVTGHYLSMYFVSSDAKRFLLGNVIHCTMKANIAHNFLKLKEGSIYLIRDFVVHPNKDEYRIFRDHAVILEFDGATFVFVRYPFELQDPGNIELINNKYLIDVAGYVTNVGKTTHQRTGSRTLDFYLTNGRVPCSIDKYYTCYFPFYKTEANKIYLSSSSSTQILDDPHIPALKEFKKGISDGEGALDQAQNRKNDVSLFLFAVTPRHYVLMVTQCYIFCSSSLPPSTAKLGLITSGPEKAGTTRPVGALNERKVLIERLEASSVTHATSLLSTRSRLELDISDQTASTVVVMFDDTATELVKCSADSIVQAEDETADVHAILPRALENVIGTTHILELKSHMYYEHGTFESFTCWRVVPEEVVEESAGSSNVDAKVPAKRKRVKTLAMHPSVSTPSKPAEDKKKKRVELEDSEEEMASAWNGAQENAEDGSASKKRKKRRYIVDESDSE